MSKHCIVETAYMSNIFMEISNNINNVKIRYRVVSSSSLIGWLLWDFLYYSLTLPEHLSSPPVFSGVRVTRSLVLCVVLCRSLFVLLSLFYQPLCYWSFFDLRMRITLWYIQILVWVNQTWVYKWIYSFNWLVYNTFLYSRIIIYI